MNFIFKKIADFFVKPFLLFYLKRKRTYRYKDFNLEVFTGVFHPGLFFSTKVLADFVETLPLTGKTFCEPGTGAGLVSLTALRKGAHITAFDINAEAVKNCRRNVNINKNYFPANSSFKLHQSDLFDQVPPQTFDFVVVNPPYFFKDPVDTPAYAWYAGVGGEYFTKFFQQLKNYIHTDSQVYMILGDNCELDRIKELAARENFSFSLAHKKKVWWEENFIFRIEGY